MGVYEVWRGRNLMGKVTNLRAMDVVWITSRTPRLQALLLYNEVLKLRKTGLTYRQIQEAIKNEHGVRLGISTIGCWISGKHNPIGRCNRIREGPELAYVLSAWLGDGTLSCWRNRVYTIRLAVKDYDFAEEWGRCLAIALNRSRPYKPWWNKRLQLWVVSGCSVLLCGLLGRAKDDPWILMPILEKYPADACRGFFDAEGYVDIRGYGVKAVNTDRRVIELFRLLLLKIGIDCTVNEDALKHDVFISPARSKVYQRKKHAIFRLAIYGKDGILRFAERVSFIIARKRAALTRLLAKYNRQGHKREG